MRDRNECEMPACEACGTLDAQTFQMDGIEFELCRHHAHVWMARTVKEGREIKEYVAPAVTDRYVLPVVSATFPTIEQMREPSARIDVGYEFWYLRAVTNTDGSRSYRLSTLHKTAKTRVTYVKTLQRYCDGQRTFVVRTVDRGMVRYAHLYRDGVRVR